MFPVASFDEIGLGEANTLLIKWGHKMGPLERGYPTGTHYSLYHNGKPVALAMMSSLIRECVGGGFTILRARTRVNCPGCAPSGRTFVASRSGSGASSCSRSLDTAT